jgi:UDP-perosamine 4-acetyltransferase
MIDKVIVIGGGGHAKVVISILKKLNIYNIVGYTDNEDKGPLLSAKYIGKDDVLNNYYQNHNVKNVVMGLGQLNSSEYRRLISDKIKRIGYNFPCVISPAAIVNEDVKIGLGTVIMDGVVINSGTKIGDFCIVNTKTSIDHDCKIGDYVHVAPGVTICGGVKIGSNTFIGAGSTIIQYKNISDNVIIAAGATVINSINEPGSYCGIPAKRVFLKDT